MLRYRSAVCLLCALFLASATPSSQQLIDRQKALDAINALPVVVPPAVIKESCNADGTGNLVDEDQDGAVDEICKTLTTPPTCTFTLSNTTATMPATASTNTVSLTVAPSGCSPNSWTATSQASWLAVGAAGSGSSVVAYTVTANTGAQRVGTLTIAGQVITVTQAAAATQPPPTGSFAFSTSFTAANGWKAEVKQNGCGTGFAGIQAGVGNHGDWGASYCDRVTSAANNPTGEGGLGFRHFRSGNNGGGGGIRVTFPAMAQGYVRYYARYAQGMVFSPLTYTKDLYFHDGESGFFILGFSSNAGTPGSAYYLHTGAGSINHGSSINFAQINGGSGNVGDGKHHCYEAFLKMGSSGQVTLFVDGAQVLNKTGINFGRSSFSAFALGGNQYFVSNSGQYTDFDDVAVSAQRIGCFPVQ